MNETKLLNIAQLGMLYKSAIYTLRGEGIELPEKHEKLSDNTPDHDAINLLDTLDILHDLIISHDNYSEVKAHNDIIDHVKSKVITVDSLDVLEQQFNLSEREIEMGYEFYLDEKFENVIDYATNENNIETLEELQSQLVAGTLQFYYAEHDRKYVAVFS